MIDVCNICANIKIPYLINGLIFFGTLYNAIKCKAHQTFFGIIYRSVIPPVITAAVTAFSSMHGSGSSPPMILNRITDLY